MSRLPHGFPHKGQVAANAWRLMFDLLMRTSPERMKSLGRRGLTPNDARSLESLDADRGRQMNALAEEWECDPSNATRIVDRLEGLGLAERKTVPHDRRVKLVVLTSKGAKTKAELREEYYTPPRELLELDDATLAALHDALAKLASDLPPPSGGE